MTRQLVGTLLVIGATLTGCASLNPSLGIRPPRPDATYGESDVNSCKRLDEYLNYSRDLQEAYHSRASQNRWWIYVAGTLGLATIAASGGLAAAAVSTTTIAVVAFAGGFYSSFFAFLGNDKLAEVYTTAANSVDAAIANTSEIVNKANGDCAAAYVALVSAVSAAATQLETDRTTSAEAALIRANAEKAVLSAQLKDLQAAQTKSSVFVSPTPLITGVKPPSVDPASPEPVTLTISNVDFANKVTLADLKVRLATAGATKPIDALEATDQPNVYKVRFTPPKDQPVGEYSPELVVNESVIIKSNVKLKYAKP